MKENSGYFWDPRDLCNHVCAHLAVAKFLRGSTPTSIEGRLADITVGLIVDTKTQTGHDLDALAAEKSPPPELAAWLNGCRMRNSRDWRIVASPETATPFEQVEYFRAYCEAADVNHAVTWLQSHSLPDRIDWTRILLEMGFPVDIGHQFATESITKEFKTMHATFPASFSGANLVGDLNEPPGDAVTFNASGSAAPTVISRGMWAQFFQRHLCHAIAETGDFYANKWAVPEQTQALDRAVDANFSGLTLYPYLQLVQHSLRSSPAQSETALASFTAHPEWAPDCLFWIKLPPDPDAPRIKQVAAAWFNPPVVHGTAYGALGRAPKDGWDNGEVDQLYAIAPLQINIAQMELKRLYGTTYTLPQVEKVLGPLMDYYVSALQLAQSSTGLTEEQQAELINKVSAISSKGYWELAHMYLKNHQDAQAANAYQKWADTTTDRVEVSDNIDWLVEYYYDHGQKDKALALATEAADEVYSYAGLETMMHLQEKMGNLDTAEDYGQKIKDRYNGTTPLAAFYKRQADKGGVRYQAKLDDLALGVFPYGMKKVTLAGLSGPPTAGVKFVSTTDDMKAAGLSADQVVVALDGYGAQDREQYTFVRSLTDSPQMDFIVWDGRAYREIVANRPGRRFGVDLVDYHH